MKTTHIFLSMGWNRLRLFTGSTRSFTAWLMISTLALVLASCGGAGGVSGGGTGGGIPVSTGPINGFASIIVAGYEFDEPISLTTSQDGLPVVPSDLGLGVHVSILGATQTLDTSALNKVGSIEIRRWFMGNLVAEQNSDSRTGVRLSINGQRILTDRRTIVVDAVSAQAFAGKKVQVAGYLEPVRNDIIATRIELAKPELAATQKAYITGRVESVSAVSQTASLGFATIDFANVASEEALQAGEIIRFEANTAGSVNTAFKATKLTKITPSLGAGDVTLRGVVLSRPSEASPNTALIVDGYVVQLAATQIAQNLADIRRGSVVEVTGRLNQTTTVQNAQVRIIGYPVDTLPGEQSVQEPPPPNNGVVDDYIIRGGIVESVNTVSNSFVLRGVRIQMPNGVPLPAEVYVGSKISIAGQVKQDEAGFYLESVITQPDRQWQAAQQIAQTDRAQNILIDSTGAARVMWIEPNTSDLQSTLYDSALGQWTAQPAISLGVGTVSRSNLDALQQNLPTHGNGRSMIAFIAGASSQGGGCIYAKKIGVSAADWDTSPPQQVSTDCTSTVDTAFSLAMDSSGNAMLVWTRQISSSSFILLASRYDAQADSWGTPVNVSGTNTTFITPYVAMDNQGSAIAAWSQGGNGSYANRYNAGSWGTAQTIINRSINNLVMDSNGNAALFASGSNQLAVRRFSIGTQSWVNTVYVFDTTLSGGGSNVAAVDRTGRIVIVWRRSNTIGALFSAQYNPIADSWSATQNIANSTQRLEVSSLSVNSTGQAILGYITVGRDSFNVNQPAEKSEAFAKRYSFANDGWSTSSVQQGLPDVAAGAAIVNKPRSAINDNGVAVMTWGQRDTAGVRRSFANVLR